MRFHLGCYSEFIPKLADPNVSIAICDSTLRDGEQAGVKYSTEEKIHIIQMLDDARIPETQITSLRNPTAIEEAKVLCAVKRKHTGIEVMSRSTAPSWRTELEGIVALHADVMHTLVPTSPWLRGSYGPALDDAALVEHVHEVVAYGKTLGAKTFNLSLLDVTRTERELLHRVIDAGVEAGADRIAIADTVGCATPEVMSGITSMVKSWIPKQVSLRVHVHNDFGMATANALACVAAGASIVDTCVNGRGKRAGNADVVQIVMALKAFWGIEMGIDLQKLYTISKEIERLSGVPIPANSPFTGELVFADDSESHILGLQEYPFAFQAIDPTDWGNPRRILIGKNSGTVAMSLKMQQLGISVQSDEMVHYVLQKCIERANRLARGKYLTDEMIMDICESIVSR